MNEQKSLPLPQIGAIAFALCALLIFFNAIRIFSYGIPFAPSLIISLIFRCAVYVFLALVLFTKRRDNMLIIAVGALCVLSIFDLLGSRYILATLSSLISFAASILLVGFVLCTSRDQFAQHAKNAKKLWFLPGVLMAVHGISSFTFYLGFSSLLSILAIVAAYFLMALWIVSTEGLQGAQITAGYTTNSRGTAAQASAPSSSPAGGSDCDLLKHILLLLFTFGIWYYIWIYRTTGYLNQVEDEPPRNPTSKLLLCMFVPFYLIYWVYKSAQRLDKLAISKGVSSDLATLCLVLAIFFGIIPPMLMQKKINSIAGVENGTR